MTKADLVKEIAANAGITQAQSEKALAAFSNAIVNNVFKGGDSVTVPGLGTFKQAKLAAKTGRNPSTGASIQIAARTKLAFKMASSLK